MVIVALDDERLGLMKLVSSLRKAIPNAEIVEFNSSKKALEYLEDNPQVEALYTDIDMPVMNGIQIANRFRSLNKLAQIVFVSGDRNHAEEAKLIKDTLYILKPYSIEDIKHATCFLH